MAYALENVNDIESLLRYCNSSFNWNIDEDYFDDIDNLTYDFTAADLGIKEEAFASINTLKQMRPISDNQEWAIFLLDFEGKKIDVGALRRILNAVIPKRTNRDRITWDCGHIFFMCLWGERSIRSIGFSAFEDREYALPIMKILYCTPKIESADGKRRFEKSISFLKCNERETLVDRLPYWTGVLQRRNHSIQSARQLTEILAEKAIQITDLLLNQFEIESEIGVLHRLYSKFNMQLNIDLTEREFMEMYSQMIVYGLFSARCIDPHSTITDLNKAIDTIPNTNPLLKNLLHEFDVIDGMYGFDELDISELIDALNATDMASIMGDFNRQSGFGKEDPIIYFYEMFLDLFEKERKKRCGVYYTPAAVVDFIVRSVRHILESKFDWSLGYLDERVAVFDPAIGTGTFLYKVIDDVFREFKSRKDSSSIDQSREWSQFVSQSLLPRLYGYEFMMAPYAIAHTKIALKLKDTGYDFLSPQRLQVYLANSLMNSTEGAQPVDPDSLESESYQAGSVHRENKVNVIISSPPFHADSKNQSEWIMSLMEDYKKEPGGNEQLNERNSKLINDDYVKFFRLAQKIVSTKEKAVIAFIMPFSFASNLTFRGMRWALLEEFNDIYIFDLHGNVMGRDMSDAPERDENILDIQSGVCIAIFVKNTNNTKDGLANVYYSDFVGSREKKYQYLLNTRFEDIHWQRLNPLAPYYFFKPIDFSNADKYNNGVSVAELFPSYLGGVKTHDDNNLVSFEAFNTSCDYLYDYRPFDIRHINYDRRKVSRDRYEIMQHMIKLDNLGLVVDRQVVTDNWSHIQIVRHMIDNRLHYSNRGIPVLCPMFLYDKGVAKPNVDPELVSRFVERMGLSFSKELTEDINSFDMLDLFDYVYGVLNSPAYINTYIDLLKIEFPKVPIPNSAAMFRDICSFGEDLRQLHLMENDVENDLNISFEGDGDCCVDARKIRGNCLYINKTQYFTNITEELWDFCYGGYHGMQKWFKDRKGLCLKESDIEHVIRVFNIFAKTISIRDELNECLDKYGLL